MGFNPGPFRLTDYIPLQIFKQEGFYGVDANDQATLTI